MHANLQPARAAPGRLNVTSLPWKMTNGWPADPTAGHNFAVTTPTTTSSVGLGRCRQRLFSSAVTLHWVFRVFLPSLAGYLAISWSVYLQCLSVTRQAFTPHLPKPVCPPSKLPFLVFGFLSPPVCVCLFFLHVLFVCLSHWYSNQFA